jgi:alpha-beta hydrolase superfamily lysophospholipase
MSADAVRFMFTRAGDRLAGMLYVPPAPPTAVVVTTGPLTSVKEQAAGAYAAALARRGFAALAFDHRTFGESEGTPRQLEDPLGKVADIGAAVSALQADERLGRLPVVALGICAGAGYMARAVADDPRIRAFAGIARGLPCRRRARLRSDQTWPGRSAAPSWVRGGRDDPGGGGRRRRCRDAATGGLRVLRHPPRCRAQLPQCLRGRIL